MSEEATSENGVKTNIKLDTEVANGIKHAVATLDESSCGTVSKSQLQAVVANVSQAIKVAFVSEDLESYLPEKDDLSVSEFLEFLESKLLVKGKKLNSKQMDELSWVVVGQKYEENPHTLTKKDAFKLWLVFKKLDISGELQVDVEELCIILEKFVRGIGVQWNEQHLVEFAEDGALTFWKFVDCLEQKFITGVDKNVLREGLQELFDHILDEVTRTGFLYKKGHSMLKSQKSRWFVLKPDKLTYYVSSGYREKKGDVILNNETKVASIPDKGSNKYRFLVTCGVTKKDYEQTAPDQRTKQAWMTDIQTAIDCFGGQTPLKRDLIARKAKRDEDRARKAEEERKRREQEDLLDQQRKEIDLLKKRKEEIERYADEEKAMLDAEIKRREELEELQRNLQQLLEDQKRAREEDEKIRAAKERLLEEERMKREQLEALRLQQQQELLNEKMQKEELMEKQKEQERVMEEERKRLQHLEEERMKAEEAARAAKEKLTAAETAAKNAAEQAKDRVRQLKTSIGLKGTVGPKVDPLVSHRGKGAFTLEEFLNRATEWSGLSLEDEERPKASLTAPEVDELVKASATPASNQNIPEFLKKAAAWSGLNPETYLEAQEEKKKNSPPPKVAAKPPKPLPTAAVNGASGDAEVSQEGKKALHEGNEGLQEGEKGLKDGIDGPVVEEEKEDEEKVEEKVEDSEGPQVTDEVSVGEAVSNEESQANDVVKDDVKYVDEKKEESNEGFEVNKEGSLVEAVDKVESKVEEADDKGPEGAVDNTDGSKMAVVDNDVPEVETAEAIEGESSEEKGNCQEEKSGEEKSACEGEVLDGDAGGSVKVNNVDNESSPKDVIQDGEARVSDQNSSEIEQTEKPEIVPEVENSENESADASGKDEAEDESEPKQTQSNDKSSEVNNEEADKNNGECEVDNAKQEVDEIKPEVNNEEKEPTNEKIGATEESGAVDESNKEDNNGISEPLEDKGVSDVKNNIVQNGQSSIEEIGSPAENEHSDNGDTKIVFPEKCGKPAENSSAQNIGTVNS